MQELEQRGERLRPLGYVGREGLRSTGGQRRETGASPGPTDTPRTRTSQQLQQTQ